MPASQIRKEIPGVRYVLYNDGVYDISHISHPGGRFIFERINGREVSRFLFGAYPLECTNMPEYRHTDFAIQLLLSKQIGKIQPIPIFNNNDIFRDDWAVSNRILMTYNIYLFEFRPYGHVM